VVIALLAARRSVGRVGAVVGRNIGAMRSGPSYLLVLLSGLVEPLLYLLSIGVGVGALIGTMELDDGSRVPYAVFVAPAMLAVSAMSGALAETAFNFFHKMKYARIYDAVLATPVGPFELVLGELTWAMIRGALYAGIFLAVMVAMGLVPAVGAVAAFPAALLVGLAFGGFGAAVATFMRGWEDFDLVTTGQFALFLFSGTFVPVRDYPAVLEVVVTLTPLYHAVELLRGLALWRLEWDLLVSGAYLLVMVLGGLWVASRRLGRYMCP
jgi:lipooligosaccharide transport system permease protein